MCYLIPPSKGLNSKFLLIMLQSKKSWFMKVLFLAFKALKSTGFL